VDALEVNKQAKLATSQANLKSLESAAEVSVQSETLADKVA